ncbi:hypothetical protein HZA41_01510, partial [Candidatus Peregrinibacteria bacterium]|nr:hypothetical protein [Candidatus Peregrinibacteria bacterium]
STVSGLGAFFTLLCPVCPIFFLTYFGLSASLLAISPYFWWIRGVSVLVLFVGLAVMWRRYEIRKFPKFDSVSFFHFSAGVVILALFFSSQAMALQLGQKMIASDPSSPVELSGDFSRDISALVTPTGIPFYGQELGLDFSSVSAINASIKKLAVMAPKQGSNPLDLNAEEMKRYVSIGTEPTVACEFCCGAKTLVREDGSPTCGCAHSMAMRGTAAYLIRTYPNMTNEKIAYELMRQKGLYFPQQMQKRMAEELSGDVKDFTPDIKYLTQNLNEDEVRDLQRQAKASGFDPAKSSPKMVGGC